MPEEIADSDEKTRGTQGRRSPMDRSDPRRLERGHVDAELILAVRLPWSLDHSSRDLCLFRDAQGQYRLEIRPRAEGRPKVILLPENLVINAATVDEVMLLMRGLENPVVDTVLSTDADGNAKGELDYVLRLEIPEQESPVEMSAYSLLRAVAMGAYSFASVKKKRG